MIDFVYNSSAVNFVDKINNNGASVFIANALGDSLFTPNQFPTFFQKLTGQKHIEFAPGDHAGPEMLGLFGLPDQVWVRANQWLDYYLLENKNDVHPTIPQVTFNVFGSNDIENYNNWDAVTSSSSKFSLEKREVLASIRLEANNSYSGEQLSQLTTGKGAHINGGVAFVSGTVRAFIDVPRHYIMPLIDRIRAGVWVSDRLKSTMRFRGTPSLSLNIIPDNADGTLIVYLLDVNNLDQGALFSYSPITFKGATPGKELLINMNITMVSYDMHPDSRLAVVISSHDLLYLDQNIAQSKISFQSGSVLTMPVHN